MDSIDSEQIDAQLRAAFTEELPDASAIQVAVRKRIAAERFRRLAALASAAAILLAVVGYAVFASTRGANVYGDLAKDHRREVMDGQPRDWKTNGAEMALLIAYYEVSPAMVNGFAPSGFHLEHAKTCGMAGKPVLHLVYSDGSRKVSVYVRKRSGPPIRTGSTSIDAEEVTAFTHDGFDAAVVTVGSSAECQAWARHAALVL
jgi:hypothetical protein